MLNQILGLVLDFDVAIAQDAECARAAHVVAGEQHVRVEPQQCLHRHEPRRLVRQAKKAWQALRDHHQFADRRSVRFAPQVEQHALSPVLRTNGNGCEGSSA